MRVAIDKSAEIGAEALTGVIYGSIGERSGRPPTEAEYDNITKALLAVGNHAKKRGISIGIEAINRYESHLINLSLIHI